MKKVLLYMAITFVLVISANSASAFEIGGAGLGAELHFQDFQDYQTVNGINKIMLSFGGEKIQDELDFLFDLFGDIAFTPPFLISQESLQTTSGDAHKLRSIAFLQNDGHAYLNFRDRIVDDLYVYGLDYEPLAALADAEGDLVVKQGECSGECWIWLGSRPGYVPILRGVSLESDDFDDHEITEIQAFIDDGNALRLAFNEKGELWGFKFIVQIAWVDEALFSGRHFEVTNEGNAVKNSHHFIRSDETMDRAVLKGFRLQYVKDEGGSSPDSHYVKEIVLDLENALVAFNDGDWDDFFQFSISYATLR
jgi:hypothetical protein